MITAVENTLLHAQLSGLDRIPQIYQALVQHTRSYLDTVRCLARIPGSFPQSATLIVDFANNVLQAQSSCFYIMLNCQRSHIYWLLDQAMLEILLSEWEEVEDGASSWPKAILPINAALNQGIRRLPEWAQRECLTLNKYNIGMWQHAVTTSGTVDLGFFRRSLEFLEESLVVYELRQRVNECLNGKLPVEIADVVIEEVSRFEGVPVKLRDAYLPKGKTKAA